MENQAILTQLGFDPTEAQIYLACLELGESPITPIATKANLPRTTAYYALDRLGKRGAIEIIYKGSRRLYVPLPPKRLLTLFQNQQNQLSEQINLLHDNLPSLNDLFKQYDFQPKVKVYRGKDIRKIHEQILESPVDEMVYVGDNSEVVKVVGETWLKNYAKRRMAKHIALRAIWIKDKEPINPFYWPNKKELRQVHHAPKGFVSNGSLLISGDNVALITTETESIGVLITSRDLAKTMMSWFNYLWSVSPVNLKPKK